MSYSLLIVRSATRQLTTLPPETYAGVLDLIRRLEVDPHPPDSEKIQGRNGWRLYAGGFRVIYEVDMPSARVTILDVSRRSDV